MTRSSFSTHRPRQVLSALTLSIAFASPGCGRENIPTPASQPTLVPSKPAPLDVKPPPAKPSSDHTPFAFQDVVKSSGITFVHRSGVSPERYAPTANGSGVALLDYDGDGLLDIYLATTRELPLTAPTKSLGNRLYRNLGAGKFDDVTKAAGVAFSGFTHGLAAGDVDNNGFPDLYLANFGPDVLYLNRGDGTFYEAGDVGALEAGRWSSAAAFLDYDADGDLDIYISCYARWSFDEDHPYCGDPSKNLRMYCAPKSLSPDRHTLLKNRGDGTFEDATEAAGLLRNDGRGLGVVAADLDLDGKVDLFVANDGCPNFLFFNRGDGTFDDAGERSGASATEAGFFQAGMGVAAEDVDGDGLPDLLLTTYRGEYDTIYRNIGGRNFQDVSAAAGVAKESLGEVGWGCGFVDLDNDGHPDMLVFNGNVDDNLIELGRDDVRQPETSRVWRNSGGGRFHEAHALGPFFDAKHVARGAAFGDLDGDGRVDAVVSIMDAPPAVLLNESEAGNWVAFDLIGRRSNRSAVGAVVEVVADGRKSIRQLKGGGSYLSSNDPRVHFGLGPLRKLDRVEVRWPSGAKTVLHDVDSGKVHPIREAAGSDGG